MPAKYARRSVGASAPRMPVATSGSFRARARRRIACAAWTVLALATGARAGAEGIEPPLEFLYRPENVLAAARVLDSGPQVLRVHLDRVLHGNPGPGEVVALRAPPWLLERVARDGRYLIGYTALRPDPRRPGELMADPDGPQLLGSLGLEPALIADTPAVRALLEGADSEQGRESRATLARLLDALQSADPPLQHLAAAQLVLEREHAQRLDDAARTRIATVVADGDAHPGARRLLLEAQARDPQHYGAGAETSAQRLVAELPVTGCNDPADGRAALAQAALRLLERANVPAPALARWTRGDCPALAELALLQLRRQDAASERAALDAALAASLLPATMREFLRDHRRRLDLMQARLPQKEAQAK